MKSTLIKKGIKFLVDNKSTILTIVEVVGVAGTAVLTAKASFKAAKKVEELKETSVEDEVKVKDIVKEVAPEFIAPAIAATITIGTCIYHNYVSVKDLASILALYKLSEDKLNLTEEGILKTVGEKKSDEIFERTMKDKVQAFPPSQSPVIYSTGRGDYLCMDASFNTVFRSQPEYVRQAFNNIRDQINEKRDGAADLNDLYYELGIGQFGLDTDLYGGIRNYNFGSRLGWDSRQGDILDPNYATIVDPITKEPIFIFSYDCNLIAKYD